MLSQEYLANPRMSQSKLKRILDGIEEFKWHLDNPTEPTEAMKLGTAVHLLLLQPEQSHHVVEMPKVDGRTTAGKLAKQEFEAALTESHIALSPEAYEKAHAMAASVRSNSDAMQILNSCESFEEEHYFSYQGIDFKAQTDGLGSNFVLDVKTTRCENKEFKIKNEILNNGYHFQAATYLQATGKKHYYIIFVRNEPPYATFPVKLSGEVIEEGRYLLDDACVLYKNCLQSNPEFKADNKLKVI